MEVKHDRSDGGRDDEGASYDGECSDDVEEEPALEVGW